MTRNRRLIRDDEGDNAKLLNLAVYQGIVDTRIHPFDDDAWPVELLQQTIADSQRVGSSYHPDLYAEQTSRRHVESNLPLATHDPITEYWAIELARLVVQDDAIGFLDSVEQVLKDVNGDYYPTSQDYWGSPYSDIADVAGCRWYLKVEDYDSYDGARLNFTRATPIDPWGDLPGAPYAERFEIDGIWYPAHCPTSRGLHWLIPSNSVLRFYLITPPTTLYTWQATGRLRATIQSALCDQAVQNARRLP